MRSKEVMELLTKIYEAGYYRGVDNAEHGVPYIRGPHLLGTVFYDAVEELMTDNGVHPSQLPLNLPNPNTGD